jgi:hypothetical protein
MRKAYGRAAGLVALAVGFAAITTVLMVIELRMINAAIPVMVILGPLMAAQYLSWGHRRPAERTTWEYLQAEPLANSTSL